MTFVSVTFCFVRNFTTTHSITLDSEQSKTFQEKDSESLK